MSDTWKSEIDQIEADIRAKRDLDTKLQNYSVQGLKRWYGRFCGDLGIRCKGITKWTKQETIDVIVGSLK